MNTMTVTAKAWTVTVPAGRYFLGDPCYAVPSEYWGGIARFVQFL